MLGGDDELIADLREMQHQLRLKAGDVAEVAAQIGVLAQLEAVLSVRSRVVLLGERNSGKTALANLLIEEEVLPVSVLANTRRPTILRHAEGVTVTGVTSQGQRSLIDASGDLSPGVRLHGLEVGMPNERLEAFDIIDTPGMTSADEMKSWNLRSNDLLVWCTLATQAWKESERRLWLSLPRRHHRHAIIVATHMDGLHGPAEVERVRSRLLAETNDCARSVVLVSSAGALSNATSEEREECGAAELEDRIAESLVAISRRRRAAAYRIANHAASKALAIMAGGSPARR